MVDRPRPPDELLIDLAAAIAERTPVDWDVEVARSPEFRPAIARLRELAALEAAFARLREAPAPGMAFRWGPLEVYEKIGAGSFADVFRAIDPSLARPVALKLRREGPAGARRWIDEARRLARVRHPHVLLVYGAQEHDGRAGLWTEWIQGRTLERVLAESGPLGAREAAAIGIDLCGALAAVHGAGLVHGDVTARNVMREGAPGERGPSGRIVLMDFGSAHDSAGAPLVAHGTPLYSAPEVLEGDAPGPRSDLYSLGVLLHHLLTARYPVEGASLAEIRARHAARTVVELRSLRPDLPGPLLAAIDRSLRAEPAARYASAAEFERAIANAQSPIAPQAAGPAAARPRARWRGAVFASLALCAVVAVGLVVARRPPASGPASPAPAPPAAADARSTAAAASGQPAAPGTAPVAGAPRVEAAMIRVTAGAREPLRSGDLVAPGDALALEFEASAPMHVYVLTEDQAGAVFVLFPLAGQGLANPLAAGERHRLPGRAQAEDLSWQVTSAGGRETFLLLASPTALSDIEAAVAGIPTAREGAAVAYPTLSPAALSELRGVGGVVRARDLPGPGGASLLARWARELERSAAERSIWMRWIVLENPRP